ncbi:hypothetical protein SteCoe_1328 [Stentor coeruleus]|uniref:Uncharacterized protein n=1 Tax=Stentor coeruleus TaxID=5963 RepID=A0A1R2D200_9CILI|nr:hypothetical protein SteCoe_1328 [Stentor coeruleus]
MEKGLYIHSSIKSKGSYKDWPIVLNTFRSKHSYRNSINNFSPMAKYKDDSTNIPIKLPNINRTAHLSFFDKVSNEYTKLCLTGCKKRIEEKYFKTTPRRSKLSTIKAMREIALGTDFVDDDDSEYFLD